MLKNIMLFILWCSVLYGVYQAFTLYPLESVIVIGIIVICIIVYWISQTLW